MNVLSVFDGISVGQVALEKAGIQYDTYFASEIKKDAIAVTQSNFPGTVQLGDVRQIDVSTLPPIDLLLGGSPCQDLSPAKHKREGIDGSKSRLFYEYARILRAVKPRFFLLENVARMPQKDKETISNELGVTPIRINSSKLSGQLRDRLYWTDIPNVEQPHDKGILLKDILESGYTDRMKARALLVSDSRPVRDKTRMWHRYKDVGFNTIVFEDETMNPTSIRYLNQTEMERLQTLPEGYTRVLSRDAAAGVLGDAWTADVIAHILLNLHI